MHLKPFAGHQSAFGKLGALLSKHVIQTTAVIIKIKTRIRIWHFSLTGDDHLLLSLTMLLHDVLQHSCKQHTAVTCFPKPTRKHAEHRWRSYSQIAI
jgi:hypothetical protein